MGYKYSIVYEIKNQNEAIYRKEKKIPNEANLLTSICSSRGQKIQRIERVAFWINSV